MDLIDERVSAFAASHVRALLADGRRSKEMLSTLASGRPFVEPEDMTIVIVDVSGYSRLTTFLSSALGKRASEVITEKLGTYFARIVSVIGLYGGDCVKFLGDAVLVAFSPVAGGGETAAEVLRRAAACCFHIMERHGEILVKSGVDEPGKNTAEPGVQQLRIHVGVVSGPAAHVILGDPSSRLDYLVYGACLEKLGPALDSAREGELGIVPESWDTLCEVVPRLRDIEMRSHPQAVVLSERGISKCLRLIVPALEDEEMESDAQLCQSDVAQRFVNRSVIAKLSAAQANNGYFASNTSDSSHSSMPSRASSISSKLHMASMSNNSEFRNISVVFIKFKSSFEAEKAQAAITDILTSLRIHDGIFQQFSVDDKGQSAMACFGLPPFSHDNDALAALRACLDIKRRLDVDKVGHFRIGVASGEILFSKINATERKEASLLGDVVNVAARLVNVEIENGSFDDMILCDEESRMRADAYLAVTDVGQHKIKGKPEPVQIWSVTSEKGRPDRSQEKVLSFGYTAEKARISHALELWAGGDGNSLILVEGPSGSGKSMLLEFAKETALSLGCIPWLVLKTARILSLKNFCSIAQGSEVDQSSPLSAMQDILMQIYMDFLQTVKVKASNAGMSRRSLDTSFYASSAILAIQQRQFSANSSVGTGISSQMHSRHSGSSILNQDAKNFLRMMDFLGESPDAAPLIASMIPGLEISDTVMSKKLDPQAKRNLLTSMIPRIMSSWATLRKTVYILDDAQFMDAATQEVLQKLAQYFPQVCLMIFTRPIDDLPNEALRNISELPSCLHFYIDGIDFDSVREMICHRLSNFNCSSVSANIVKTIFENSEGSPLRVDMLISSFKLKAANMLVVNAAGELSLKDSADAMEKYLVDSVGAAVTVQFDRINPEFQSLLKHATTFGICFTLKNVADLINSGGNDSDTSVTEDDLFQVIAQCDNFGFLRYQDSDAEAVSKTYYFRHITILETITELIAFKERRSMHLSAAKLFEAAMLNSNLKDFLLPLVAHHYYSSDDNLNASKYLEILASQYAASWLPHEGLQVTAKLMKLYDSKALSDLGIRPVLWLGTQALMQAQKRDFDAAFKSGIRAMEEAGVKVPKDAKQATKMTLREGLRQYLLFRETKGGRRSPKKLDQKLDNPERLVALKFAVNALILCGVYDEKFPRYLAAYFGLLGTNIIIKDSIRNKYDWAVMCMRMAYAIRSRSIRISDAYLKVAEELALAMEHGMRYQALPHISVVAWKGDFGTAMKLADEYAEYSHLTGHGLTELVAISIKCTYLGYRGQFNTLDFDETMPIVVNLVSTDIFSALEGYYILGKNELFTDSDHVYSALTQFENAINLASSRSRIPKMALGAFHFFKAWCNFFNDEHVGFLENLEEANKCILDLNLYRFSPNDALMSSCVLSWLWLEKVQHQRSHDRTRRPEDVLPEVQTSIFSPSLASRFRQELEGLIRNSSRLGCQDRVIINAIGWHIAKAAAIFLDKGRSAAISRLHKVLFILRKPRKGMAPLSNEMAFIEAFVLAAIGIYSDSGSKGRAFLTESLARFKNWNARLMVKWIQPHLNHSVR